MRNRSIFTFTAIIILSITAHAQLDLSLHAQLDLTITGYMRIRVSHINADNTSATGPFGELIENGGKSLFLLKPTIELEVMDNIVLGSHFRLTNISNSAMFGAPDYYLYQLVSPYINAEFGNAKLVLGYFQEYFSELTLIRWDKDDNPPGAGGSESGCPECSGMPGVMSFDNLEEIDKELGFNGYHFQYAPEWETGNIDFKIFYTQPTVVDREVTYYNRYMLASAIHGSKNVGAFDIGVSINAIHYQEDAGKYWQSFYATNPLLWHTYGSAIVEMGFWDAIISLEKAWNYSKERTPIEIGNWITDEDNAFFGKIELEPQIGPTVNKIQLAYIDIGKNYNAQYKSPSFYLGEVGFRGILRNEIKLGMIELNDAFYYKAISKAEIEKLDALDVDVNTLGMSLGMNMDIKDVFTSLNISASKQTSSWSPTEDVHKESVRDIYVVDFAFKPWVPMTLSATLTYIDIDDDISRIFHLTGSLEF